jgi:A/G-specific adenine glycosylase
VQPLQLSKRLLTWFDANRRDLPWRHNRSPYRVWLSEVMLQQTQVVVVEGYFRRVLARFPDVQSLAAADEDAVLAMWSGLGYYSRGRNLHRAAKIVAEQGGFPSTAQALRALPGVGAYTSAAIASLAFGERIAVVDGNVHRVLSRVAGSEARIAERAQALVDVADNPGAMNESLMELGALVCTPKAPKCDACPWRKDCVALREGTVLELPAKKKKQARKSIDVACVVVNNGDEVWLERRKSRGLFGGLYEPPSAPLDGDLRSIWKAILKERNIPAPKTWPKPIVVERTLTHRDLKFHVARVSFAGDGPWVKNLDEIGVSNAVRAVLNAASVAPARAGRA